jgi:hypothetical protein
MQIKVDLSGWKQTGWHEYALRFLFGGAVTCMAGIIAKEYGPIVGGLFLAFPAIFPASATLIQKHEEEKKREQGMRGERRARQVTSVDAAGAALGSLGLIVFGLIVWQLLPTHNAAFVISGATVAWGSVAVAMWFLRKRV